MITHTLDSICAPCPHNQVSQCASQTKIEELDEAHASALALNALKEITWQQAKDRIKEYISLAVFDRICAPCEWKALGYCERALCHFLSEDEN